MKNIKCHICGKTDQYDCFIEETANRMHHDRLCFECLFWVRQEEDDRKNVERVAIIEGNHFVIDDEKPTARFRGFDGREFLIKFNDGRKVRTTNLWHQGEIPERFRKQFPNNAIFGKE